MRTISEQKKRTIILDYFRILHDKSGDVYRKNRVLGGIFLKPVQKVEEKITFCCRPIIGAWIETSTKLK